MAKAIIPTTVGEAIKLLKKAGYKPVSSNRRNKKHIHYHHLELPKNQNLLVPKGGSKHPVSLKYGVELLGYLDEARTQLALRTPTEEE